MTINEIKVILQKDIEKKNRSGLATNLLALIAELEQLRIIAEDASELLEAEELKKANENDCRLNLSNGLLTHIKMNKI